MCTLATPTIQIAICSTHSLHNKIQQCHSSVRYMYSTLGLQLLCLALRFKVDQMCVWWGCDAEGLSMDALDCLPLVNKMYFNSRTAVFYIHTPFCTPTYYQIYNTTCTHHMTDHVVTCIYVFHSSHVHVFHQSLHIT